MLEIGLLEPYLNNARIHTESQINFIVKSLTEFGFINPVIINKDNVLIAGHGRLIGAKRLGLKKVPCVKIEHLTPKQEKAYRLADNRLAELSNYDPDLLKVEISDLLADNFDMLTVGFDEDDISALYDTTPSGSGDGGGDGGGGCDDNRVICPKCGHAFEV